MFYYITSNLIPAVNANSVQIISNCEILHQKLGKQFSLLSPTTANNLKINSPYWIRIKCFFKKRSFRYIEFAIKTLFLIEDLKAIIYTRDIFVALLHTQRGARVFYESHDRPSFVADLMLKYSLKKSNFKIIAISQALKCYLVGRFSLDERRVLVAHDGVFINEYQNVSPNKSLFHSEFEIPTDHKIILHTGSLYPGRGSELFKHILEKFQKVSLVHIGGSNSILDQIKESLNGKNFFSKTHIPRQELVKYQVSADVLLLPVLRSTKIYWCFSPMKLFEYMASKVPIVCSSIGSIPEIVTDKEVYFFEPENVDSLIRAINEALYGDQSKIKPLAAFEKALSNYSWEDRVNSILKFIHNQ